MPTPSLLIVPARFKTGKLYSQIPTSGAGDFTVTRNTAARRFDSAGLIESVASGIPRLDYFTSGGVTGCPALLVEPSAVNLVLHSRDLTNAVWSGTNVTTAKNAVGADGVASGATTLTATAASGTVLQAISHASQSRVFSAYVRRVTGTGAIQMTTNGGTNWTTVTISSLYTQVACAAQTVASGTVGFRMAVSGDVIEVDFTQGEVGPVATSPIPTTAGTGSRSADVISLSSASGFVGQTEGTLYVEFTGLHDENTEIIAIRANTALDNYAGIGCGAGKIYATVVTDPGLYRFNTETLKTIPNNTFKVALAYKSGDFGLFIDGQNSASGTDTYTPPSPFTQVVINEALFFGKRPVKVLAVALYTTRLTNAELATLTTP